MSDINTLPEPTEAPLADLKAGQIVSYAGRVGIIVAVRTEQADGSPFLKPDTKNPLAIDRAIPEAAYEIAWFESVSHAIPQSVLDQPHPSEL